MLGAVARECVREWLVNKSGADNGILYFVLNGVRYRTAHIPDPLPQPAHLSIVFDSMKLCAYHAQLCQFVLLRHYYAELFFEEQVSHMLRCNDLAVYLRPVSLPYAALQLASLAQLQQVPRGRLFQIKLRILDVAPIEHHGDDDARVASQLMRVCFAHSTPGAREEAQHATLRISNDLLTISPERRIGDVIQVVAHAGAFLSDKGHLVSVMQAVFLQYADTMRSPTRPPGGCMPTRARSFQDVLQLCNMLRDPEIAETGSTDHFRLSLLLSSVICQTRSTTQPVHLLACGDVLQDVDRMMRVAATSSVATVFTPPSLHQLLHSALALTVRGVCRVSDLQDLVGRQAALNNKLVEFLGSATSATCGTLWAQLPQFGKASDAPLDKEYPVLARGGLSRCFSLVHRCATPSESSLEDMRQKHLNDGTEPSVFDVVRFRDAVLLAVQHLDRTTVSATPAAAKLMEDFVFVSRRLRNQTTSEVSIHAVGLLFVLARAHAALCLRNEVTEEDATVGIYLLEESLLAKTGKSLLSFSPLLGCGKSNLGMYGSLQELHGHIRRLVNSHAPRED